MKLDRAVIDVQPIADADLAGGLGGNAVGVDRPISQALEASSRVLKKRAAQSHLSMRVPSMRVFSYRRPNHAGAA